MEKHGRRSGQKRTSVLFLRTKPEMTKQSGLDEIDFRILRAVQEDCRTPLETVAEELGVPKSTVHYRVRRLEKTGVIERYFAKVNATKLGKDYLVVVLVRAKYGPRYHERIGKKMAAIVGVWAVYYVLGDNDFVLLVRANDRGEYMNILEKISGMADIERTSSQVVVKVIKEDPRIFLT